MLRSLSYMLFGALPASVLVIFSSGLLLSEHLFEQLWGLASVLGVMGLWSAVFYEVEKTKFCIVICIFLIFGIMAIMPIAKNILSFQYPSFYDLTFIAPIIMALHYCASYISFRLKGSFSK